MASLSFSPGGACEDSDFIFGQSIFNDGGRGFQAYPTPGYKTVTDAEYAKLATLEGGA